MPVKREEPATTEATVLSASPESPASGAHWWAAWAEMADPAAQVKPVAMEAPEVSAGRERRVLEARRWAEPARGGPVKRAAAAETAERAAMESAATRGPPASAARRKATMGKNSCSFD